LFSFADPPFARPAVAMSKLTRFLFPLPAPRSAPAIVAWWERRRPAYNLIVGGTGLVTLAIVRLLFALPPSGSAMPPFDRTLLPGIAIYGIAANVCYTLGWMVEGAMHALWGDRVRPAGAVLFRQGLIFAVGVTLLPVVVAGFVWVARAVSWIMH
jgi:hypothetical protein